MNSAIKPRKTQSTRPLTSKFDEAQEDEEQCHAAAENPISGDMAMEGDKQCIAGAETTTANSSLSTSVSGSDRPTMEHSDTAEKSGLVLVQAST